MWTWKINVFVSLITFLNSLNNTGNLLTVIKYLFLKEFKEIQDW